MVRVPFSQITSLIDCTVSRLDVRASTGESKISALFALAQSSATAALAHQKDHTFLEVVSVTSEHMPFLEQPLTGRDFGTLLEVSFSFTIHAVLMSSSNAAK